MTLDDFHKRVWRGLHDLGRDVYNVNSAKIVVHPATRAMLARDAEQYMVYRVPDDGTERYRGLLLELDDRLDEDSILIRHEVEA